MTYLISAKMKEDIFDKLNKLETEGAYLIQVDKTGAFSVTNKDNRKIFSCTGTFTITLPNITTMPSGMNFMVKNNGSGTLTIETTSGQKIDNVTSKTVTPNECIQVICATDKYLSSQTSSFIVP